MSSKFIPNKGRQTIQNDYSDWSSHPKMKGNSKVDFKEIDRKKKEYSEERKAKDTIKKEIESKNLNEVTFSDIYSFPLKMYSVSNWVYDANGNFVFQFEGGFENFSKNTFQKILDYLNGDTIEINRQELRFHKGTISIKLENELEYAELITIRGWVNLTGTGSYNLDGDYAAKIQDTLGGWLMSKLQKI